MEKTINVKTQVNNFQLSASVYRGQNKSSSLNTFFQPKLTINQPNDIYEQEADTIAERVMRMPDTKAESLFFQPRQITVTRVQRKCTTCEQEEKLQRKEDEEEALQMKPAKDFDVQRKCSHCEEEGKVQMKGESNTGGGMTAPSIVHDVINSPGQKLDSETKNFMESRFGYDFGNVQIHNDSLAHQSSSEINALAYTHGNHVVFGERQYRPNTSSGKQLLAHELTHVVQQEQGENKIQCDRDPEFSVEGLFSGRAGEPDFIFFDIKKPDQDVNPETSLDSDEKKKIKKFASAHTSGIDLYGFASEEGGERDNDSLVDRRLKAVKNVLTSTDINYDSTKISINPMRSASESQFRYRFWRAVEMKEIHQSSSREQSSESIKNRGLEDCSDDKKNSIAIPSRNEAVKQIDETVKRLDDYISDKTAHIDTGNALQFLFKSNSTETAKDVNKTLKASSVFLGRMESILQCGNDKSVDCGTTVAAMASEDGIVLCLSFFNSIRTLPERASVLVHESAHGIKPRERDRAYNWERVMKILNTRQALNNADSFAFFVKMINTGIRPDLGPKDPDTTKNCGTNEDMVNATVAWAQRWNTYAVGGLQQTYGNKERTELMAPHINFYFGRSDRSALAGILDRYLDMMKFFSAGPINIECVDRNDPLYHTWKIAEWDKTSRTVRISIEQLRRSNLNDSDRIKYIYGALAVDRFGAPEKHRMAYPNIARDFKLFYWKIEG